MQPQTETSLFDLTRTGGRMTAERKDRLGEEQRWRARDEMDPGHTRGDKMDDPEFDLRGDWSWKPDRYPEDPGRVWSAAEVAALNRSLA